MSSRKRHNNGFKAQMTLEAIRDQRTIAEIANEYGVHPSQVNTRPGRLWILCQYDIMSTSGRCSQQISYTRDK